MKKIIITGNVARDADIRISHDGTEYATFSVGVSVGTKQNPKTDWVDVNCNGKLADIARNYVKKGTKVLIDGFPTTKAYMSRDNKPMASLQVFANNIELIGSRSDAEQKPVQEKLATTDLNNDDNIPF